MFKRAISGVRDRREKFDIHALKVWVALSIGIAVAVTTPAVALSDADRRDIARVEAYLNGVRSVRATFVQVSSTGQTAGGRLFLQRPRQLRLDYRPPTHLQIYANGFWLAFIDTELDEVTHVPLSSTPANLLVRERVRLSGDVSVTQVERGANSLRLHLVQSDEPGAGRVVLTLTDRPLRLHKWTVVDPQGVETQVSLINPEFNVRIQNDIFNFDETKYQPLQ